MRTIEQIIKENWFTLEELRECEKKWICNGMGWKWWIQWTNLMRALPYFQWDKEKKLLNDLDLVADIHDISYYKWWNVFDFLKSNYILWLNIMRLLYWTNTFDRLLVFIIVFGGTTLFGSKYFNWISK